jgi:hypothetical protein
VEPHAVGESEPVIGDLMDEGMVKPEAALDGSEVTEVNKAC